MPFKNRNKSTFDRDFTISSICFFKNIVSCVWCFGSWLKSSFYPMTHTNTHVNILVFVFFCLISFRFSLHLFFASVPTSFCAVQPLKMKVDFMCLHNLTLNRWKKNCMPKCHANFPCVIYLSLPHFTSLSLSFFVVAILMNEKGKSCHECDKMLTVPFPCRSFSLPYVQNDGAINLFHIISRFSICLVNPQPVCCIMKAFYNWILCMCIVFNVTVVVAAAHWCKFL